MPSADGSYKHALQVQHRYCIHQNTHTHTQPRAHTHANTHTPTHKHKHTHAQTHTNTHTHKMHTQDVGGMEELNAVRNRKWKREKKSQRRDMGTGGERTLIILPVCG